MASFYFSHLFVVFPQGLNIHATARDFTASCYLSQNVTQNVATSFFKVLFVEVERTVHIPLLTILLKVKV
jgi:hypothetical protein